MIEHRGKGLRIVTIMVNNDDTIITMNNNE